MNIWLYRFLLAGDVSALKYAFFFLSENISDKLCKLCYTYELYGLDSFFHVPGYWSAYARRCSQCHRRGSSEVPWCPPRPPPQGPSGVLQIRNNTWDYMNQNLYLRENPVFNINNQWRYVKISLLDYKGWQGL